MTFAINMDRDQAQIVGPDLQSILFDTRDQYWQKIGCFASHEVSLGDDVVMSNL